MLKPAIAFRRTALCLAAACCIALGLADTALARETTGDYGWWLPENVFPASEVIDRLFYFILYMTGVVNIAVFAVLIWFLVRYRHKVGRKAAFVHGHDRLELVWTLVPTVILALTAVFSQTTWTAMKHPDAMPTGDDVIEVRVYARQFAWYFHYPGADGKFGPRRPDLVDPSSTNIDELVGLDRSHPDATDDIIATQMYIPVNRKVRVTQLTSVDVIHSFYLPNFRVKQDAVPGLNTQVWLEANKTSAQVMGAYADGSPKPFDIVCAELCGANHYAMRGQLFVVSQEEYDEFLRVQASYLVPDDDDFGY